jgi:chromosome segregation ATPase
LACTRQFEETDIMKRITRASLRAELTAAERELAEVQAERTHLRDTLDKAIIQLNERPAQHEREVARLRESVATMRLDIGSLKEALNTCREQAVEALAADTRAQQEVRRLREERSKLIGSLKQLEIVIAAMAVAFEASGAVKIERFLA